MAHDSTSSNASLSRERIVEEALALLAEHPDARVMAGGSDNLVKLRDGKLGGLEWVSIYGLDELRRISREGDGTLRIGPLASLTAVSKSEVVRQHVGSLAEAVLTVGDIAINR